MLLFVTVCARACVCVWLSACVCVLNRKTELLLVFAVLTFSKTPVKVIEMSSSLRNLHLLANIYIYIYPHCIACGLCMLYLWNNDHKDAVAVSKILK